MFDEDGNLIGTFFGGYDYHGANVPTRAAGNDPFPIRPPAQNTWVNPGGNENITPMARLGASATNVPSTLQQVAVPSNIANFNPSASAVSGGGFGARFGANMSSPEAMTGMASGIGGIIQGLVGRGKRRRAQEAAQTEYDKMLTQYRQLDTSNLYADVENQYTGMENVYEDLTVNQQQAQFEAQQGAQQRANIMANLQGAAGGSGIAGLAQAMAMQGQIDTQRASASIGAQEARIQQLRAGEAARLQQLERAGEARAEQMRLAGATQARGLEYQLTGTQLGMAQQDLAARNRAIAQADAALYGGIGQVVGTVATAGLGGIGGGK